MSDTVIEGTEFNCENIKYSSPKTNSVGGKSVNIFSKITNSRLNISTPMMLTWGASDYVDKSSGQGNGKFEMSLQFPNEDYKNEEASLFLDNLKKFEDKIKNDALANSKNWFGKVHKSLDILEALYSPMLKYSKDKNTGEYDLTKAPSIRIKLPVWEGTWRCEVYDDEGTKLFPGSSGVTPVDLIPKATNVKVLMTCGGIWFANGKFGITWKLVQAMVQKPRPQLSGRCFLKPSAKPVSPPLQVEEPPITPPSNEVEVQIVQPVQPEALVEDSDCDDEDDHKSTTSSVKEDTPTTTVPITESTKKPRKVVKKKE
jgi:hypothetical protein